MAIVPATVANSAEIFPADYCAPLILEDIFGRKAPLEVDLGCGDGSFLAAAAAANPDRNFLGVERLVGRVRSACWKIEHGSISNVRILRFEISYAVSHLLPPGSVGIFHLMFPDPWPKRRHASRRIITANFLAALHRALAPVGVVRIATDEIEYFRRIERLAAESSQFAAVQEEAGPVAVSTFEKRFRQDGLEIHRFVLRRVSDVT